jgi:hypothetical protein
MVELLSFPMLSLAPDEIWMTGDLISANADDPGFARSLRQHAIKLAMDSLSH